MIRFSENDSCNLFFHPERVFPFTADHRVRLQFSVDFIELPRGKMFFKINK